VVAERQSTLGTSLRHLIEALDAAVEEAYTRAGLNYRPRYTPVVRALIETGPASIRAISLRASISHSAVSQTVSQMRKAGLVRLRPGGDARERIVALTAKAEAMVPSLERHWAATNAAARALDGELSAPLLDLVREAIAALERRPFADRIGESVARLHDSHEVISPVRQKKR
jgi:DNA-binding MarR family transcriptional regulator